MDIDLAALPDDVETLQQLVRSLAAERASPHARRRPRSNGSSSSSRSCSAASSAGAPSGSMTISCSSALKTSTPILRGPKPGFRPAEAGHSPRPQGERPSLPAHLPREDILFDVEHEACPCCGGTLHLIGETVSEMLDHVPAQLRVIRIRRPRYGCRACGTIHQAPAPERPIAKGLATPALLAHVLVSKYCDHLPLYRQSQIFARHGVELDRSTSANWVGGACWWLEPLQARLAGTSSHRRSFRRRHADPGARSRPRPHQDRPAVGLRP